jgi:hypothetical protein
LYKAFPNGGVLQGLGVSQRGAGANMSVDIAIGDAIIPRSDATYGHPCFNDAVLNKTITTADPSNPRRDIVIMYVDYTVTPSTGVSNNTNGVVATKVVAGTPAGSPVDPSDSALQSAAGSGNPYIKLARVRVGAGVTSIGNSVIDDLRTLATPIPGNVSPAGQLLNGVITPSVSSNNLTVAVKTLAGNDPSDTDPVFIRIGNTVRKITAALSVTKNSGTNWFGSGGADFATKEVDYFVHFIWNTTDVAVSIAFSRLPTKTGLYSDFSSTTTNPKYLAYSGSAPASTDVCQIAGRFNAILSASASYNWSIPATPIVINQPIRNTRWLDMIANQNTGFSSQTDKVCRYRIDNDKIECMFAVSGTSNSSSLQIDLPFPCANVNGSGCNFEGNTGLCINNGSVMGVPARVYLDPASNNAIVYIVPTAGTGSFTASGSKTARWSMVYEPA